MRKILIASLFTLLTLSSLPALADDKLMVMDAWAKPAAGANTAGYMTLHNMGSVPVTVTGFSSSAAKAVMAHETVTENGIGKMRSLKSVTIQPDEMLTMAPGGNHLMIMGATQPLAEGTAFPVEIHFADGSTQLTALDIQKP